MNNKISNKNLIGEIERYGYVYSFKNMLIQYFVAVLLSILAGYLFKLSIGGYAVLIITAVLVTPGLVRSSYKNAYEQRRFSDVNKYVEKILYYFKSSGKILDSLDNALQIFSDGEMHDCISKAIEYIVSSDEIYDVEENALKIIDKAFPCEKVKNAHKFMLMVEKNGGEYDLGIEMLLQEKNNWVNRIIALQRDRAVVKIEIIGSIIMTVALCLGILYIPQMVHIESADISNSLITQLAAIVMLVLMFGVYSRSSKKMSTDWLQDEDNRSDEYWEKKYNDYISFDMKKGAAKCKLYAIVPVVVTTILYILFASIWIVICGAFVTAFVLNMHKISQNLERKDIINEISKKFPQWMLNITLFLQTENVQMSIAKSFEAAPGILKPAIEKMLIELGEDPLSPTPYNEFLKEFNMSEVEDTMSSLYSISTAAGGDIQQEFRNIIEQNNKLMDMSQKQKNEEKLIMYRNYVKFPMLVGTCKLIVDMTVLLLVMLNSANTIV